MLALAWGSALFLQHGRALDAAEARWAEGLLDAVEAEARRAIEALPASVEAWVVLGRSLELQAEARPEDSRASAYQGAIDAYAVARSLAPRDARVEVRWLQVRRKSGAQTDPAPIEDLVRRAPHDAVLLAELARAQAAAGQSEAAMESFREGFRLFPDYMAEVFRTLERIQEGQGVDLWMQVLPPEYLAGWRALARAYSRVGNWTSTLECLEVMARGGRRLPGPYRLMQARGLVALGRLDEARTLLERLESDPSVGRLEAYELSIEVHLKQGRLADAAEVASRADEAYPGRLTWALARFEHAFGEGDLDRAQRLLDRIRPNLAGRARTLMAKGRIFLRRGKLEEDRVQLRRATQLFQQAQARDPALPGVSEALYDAYLALGDELGAREVLRARRGAVAPEAAPRDPNARERREDR